MSIRVDITALAGLITDVREVAEAVRTYGSCGGASIAVKVPMALYVIAAQMESTMRSITLVDYNAGRSFYDGPPTAPEPITFDGLRTVPTQVTPSPISRDVQVAELNAAAARLRAITQALAEVMVTRSTSGYVDELDGTAAAIETFAAAVG